jgi:hypothetical protein
MQQGELCGNICVYVALSAPQLHVGAAGTWVWQETLHPRLQICQQTQLCLSAYQALASGDLVQPCALLPANSCRSWAPAAGPTKRSTTPGPARSCCTFLAPASW